MEFHEKLQELRKGRGLTQEQLSNQLYVSRAAVSKWESGRGYPSIDSLKAIAAFYGITIDDLLSTGEILTLAEENQKQQRRHFSGLVFGLLDLCAVAYLFLPLFGDSQEGMIRAVSLFSLTGVSSYLKMAEAAVIVSLILWGIQTLVLPKPSTLVSLLLHILGTLLFIISSQPYAAAFGFLLLGIKVILAAKKQ